MRPHYWLLSVHCKTIVQIFALLVNATLECKRGNHTVCVPKKLKANRIHFKADRTLCVNFCCWEIQKFHKFSIKFGVLVPLFDTVPTAVAANAGIYTSCRRWRWRQDHQFAFQFTNSSEFFLLLTVKANRCICYTKRFSQGIGGGGGITVCWCYSKLLTLALQ